MIAQRNVCSLRRWYRGVLWKEKSCTKLRESFCQSVRFVQCAGSLTSSARYGEEVEVENQTRNKETHTYDMKTLLAKFSFRYRPLGGILTYLSMTLYWPKLDVCKELVLLHANFLVPHLNLSPLSICTSRPCNVIPIITCSLSDRKKLPLPDIQTDAVALKAIAITDDRDYQA